MTNVHWRLKRKWALSPNEIEMWSSLLLTQIHFLLFTKFRIKIYLFSLLSQKTHILGLEFASYQPNPAESSFHFICSVDNTKKKIPQTQRYLNPVYQIVLLTPIRQLSRQVYLS